MLTERQLNEHLQQPVHSREPWEVHDASHPAGEDGPTICAMNGDGSCHEIAVLTGCQGMSHEHLIACGERIVACVNLLAGIPTESLIRERHCAETALIRLLVHMTPENRDDLSAIVTEQMVASCTEFLRGQGYVVKDPHDA